MKKQPEEVAIHYAKTHLSRLLAKVSRGRTIIIKKGSRPVAQLIPVRTAVRTRTFGLEKGRITIAEDFDSMPEVFKKHFRK
ncbi:MAG: type II toxin-antitoxin system prevent-host-death family antitoxin [Deltaproteobacteria bacterium]|nr:type II toxin-antitoxin system prevent-host-death family antitoxin [Deltaproteobacteria bacterium]